MLNIWIIQIGEPLLISGDERKMRSNLLAEELARRGHQVTLWVSAFDHNAKKWAIRSGDDLVKRENIRIVVLRGTGYRKNVSLARIIDHRLISWRFRKQAGREEKPDIIVASLPPHDLTYQAVKYAGKAGVPVIVDIRDPWPNIFIDHFPERIRFLGKALLFNDFRMAKKAINGADSLTAVSNSFLEWGLRYANRQKSDQDRVFYLGYHKLEVETGIGNLSEEFREVLEELNDRMAVTYIGTFSETQGPSVMTECAKRLASSDIAFVFTGYGQHYERAKAEFKDHNDVFFVGWLNQIEIDALLVKSSVGLCPYSIDSMIFPNKACMYLSAGLPVVSSYRGDLHKLIESERLGINFSIGDPDSLEKAIRSLKDNAQLYSEMSRNARVAFERFFLESDIYSGFAEHLKAVAGAK